VYELKTGYVLASKLSSPLRFFSTGANQENSGIPKCMTQFSFLLLSYIPELLFFYFATILSVINEH
jgi:hypothetical protein